MEIYKIEICAGDKKLYEVLIHYGNIQNMLFRQIPNIILDHGFLGENNLTIKLQKLPTDKEQTCSCGHLHIDHDMFGGGNCTICDCEAYDPNSSQDTHQTPPSRLCPPHSQRPGLL